MGGQSVAQLTCVDPSTPARPNRHSQSEQPPLPPPPIRRCIQIADASADVRVRAGATESAATAASVGYGGGRTWQGGAESVIRGRPDAARFGLLRRRPEDLRASGTCP